MSYALFCLGNCPEVQKKAQEEINEVFYDQNEPITKFKLAQLKYLERVIKESLRMFPSVPNISRVLDHDVEIGMIDLENYYSKINRLNLFFNFF